MNWKSFIIAVVLGVLCAPVHAEEPALKSANEKSVHALELAADKTIIHPQELGYNANTTLDDILHILPELINRMTGSLEDNYSVQLDGKDVGDAKNVVLMRTRLGEIDCIEVSTSPTASQQAMGHGGTINVKLLKPEEGTHGSAYLGASTAWMVQPGFFLTHKTGKLELRSTMMIEYSSPEIKFHRETLRKRSYLDPHRTLYVEDETGRKHDLSEAAKIDLTYHFNSRNQLRVWLMENGALSRQKSATEAESHTAVSGDTLFQFCFGNTQSRDDHDYITVNALAEYELLYNDQPDNKLTIQAGYNYRPERAVSRNHVDGTYYSEVFDRYNRRYKNLHNVSTKLATKHVLPTPGTGHRLLMEAGLNTDYNLSLVDYKDTVHFQHGMRKMVETDNLMRDLYVSPYLEWTYTWRGLSAKAGVRYQYYNRMMNVHQVDEVFIDPKPEMTSEHSFVNHDVTANLNVAYDIDSCHSLRLMAARNLIRPSALQTLDTTAIDWSAKTIYGRSNVTSAHTYNVNLDYVFDWAKNGHKLFLNVGVGVLHSMDLIVSDSRPYAEMPEMKEVSFSNGGTSTMGNVNLSLCYRYEGLNMCFSGKTFFDKSRYYFNLVFSPYYDFPRNWCLGGQLMYFSRIQNGASYTGDSFYAQLRLHKAIRNWTIYMELDDIFDYVSTDKKAYSDNEYMMNSYDPYTRALTVGFNYTF